MIDLRLKGRKFEPRQHHCVVSLNLSKNINPNTRDVFYVRREVDLMKTAKVNAYIMHIFGKIELLSIYAT